MESVLQKAGVHRNDTIFQKSVDSQITADNYTLETIKEFVYLGDKTENHSCPTGATMVSMGNCITETSLVRRN